MRRFNNKIAIAAMLSLTSIVATAVVVDPNEYFALSQPFHGGETLFISDAPCSVKLIGIDQTLLDRFGMSSSDPKKQRWGKAALHTRYGDFHNCWAPVIKNGKKSVFTCGVEDGKVTAHCTVLALTFFSDTTDLPSAPK